MPNADCQMPNFQTMSKKGIRGARAHFPAYTITPLGARNVELRLEVTQLKEKLAHAEAMFREIKSAPDLETAKRRASAGLRGIF